MSVSRIFDSLEKMRIPLSLVYIHGTSVLGNTHTGVSQNGGCPMTTKLYRADMRMNLGFCV